MKMKHKRVLAAALAAGMLAVLCACAGKKDTTPAESESQTESRQQIVTDMIGRDVEVNPGTYRKVVCIGAGALRMYSYVGDMNLLSGVEDIDNQKLPDRPKMFDAVARPYVVAFGDRLSELPSCGVGGPAAQTAEAEKILTCEPDIVVSEYEDVEKANALQEQLGVPVITLGCGPDGVFDQRFRGSMELLGEVFDRTERAEELISFVETETKEISDRTAGVAEADRPSVYICGLGNWGTTNHLMTAQNYMPFRIAHVNNAVNDLEKDGIQPIEMEKFAAIGEDVDIMLMDAAAVKNIKPLFQEDRGLFDSCRAWREGQVYLQMAYNAYYTNFETALINTWFVAKTAYPDLFADVDMRAKTDEITGMFLGRSIGEEIFAFPGSFGGYRQIDPATFFD